MTAHITVFRNTPEDRRFKWALLLSCALHGIVLFILIGIPEKESATIYYSPIYSVNLVDMPIGAAGTGAPSAGPGQQQPSGPPARTMEKISLWDGGSAQISSEARTISERQHPLLTFTGKTPEQPEREIRDRRQTSAGRQHGETGKQAEGVAGHPSGAGIEGTGEGGRHPGTGVPAGGRPLSASEMRFASYYQSIWERIQGAWAFPAQDKSRSDLETILVIRIARDGKIVDTRFEKRSGDPLLDRSAMRAVQKASPLPPLPDGFRENFMELGIRFMPGGVM